MPQFIVLPLFSPFGLTVESIKRIRGTSMKQCMDIEEAPIKENESFFNQVGFLNIEKNGNIL
jgi:hypothetical protein